MFSTVNIILIIAVEETNNLESENPFESLIKKDTKPKDKITKPKEKLPNPPQAKPKQTKNIFEENAFDIFDQSGKNIS